MNQQPDLDFAGLFADIEAGLRLDLSMARRALGHRGLRGSGAEDAFRQFLQDHLPPSHAICTGEVIDSRGGRTRQLDAVIYDAIKTPTFYRSEGIRVLPVECVYAVIEIKSFLDGNGLQTILKNMESVRSLDKVAFLHPRRVASGNQVPINDEIYEDVLHFDLYGKRWPYWPINYFVFAYNSIDLHQIAQLMINYNEAQQAPCHKVIDMVCSLDKGLIANRLISGKYWAIPEPGATLNVDTSGNTLLNFYGLMSQVVSQATLPVFEFAHYLQHATRPRETTTGGKHMMDKPKLTIGDVEAARHEVEQIEARIQAEGEEAVRQDIWDQAIDAMQNHPDIEKLTAKLAALVGRVPRERDPEREAVHQAVVRFIHDLQEKTATWDPESGSTGERQA
jgi:hypothetical protein